MVGALGWFLRRSRGAVERHLGPLRTQCVAMKLGEQMVEEYVLDTDKGFASPVGVNTRAADSPQMASSDVRRLAHGWPSMECFARSSLRGYFDDLKPYKCDASRVGYPVAPEAWKESQGMGLTLLQLGLSTCVAMIEWLAGLDYSIPDQQFTFAPHLPSTWDYIEAYTPVVFEGETQWVHTRVDRKFDGDQVSLLAEVNGNPLKETIIAPYTEDRALIATSGPGEAVYLAPQ